MLDFLGDLRRTHTCGALRSADAGARVVLMGWVNRRRDLGHLIFVDVRDRTGVTQVVFNKEASPSLHEKASTLRAEYVVAVIGEVKRRDPATVNQNLATGEVEVVAAELKILNVSKTPPFSPAETVLPNEEARLTYRYIDLRRPEMQANIELRHRVALAIRNNLSAQGFFEIETPFMTRSTPEGARDYLVPSRVHPGSFYALPQSPQLFKQILMISGFDKYFQIVRCFRDEDLRADRQPEFTQIDLEITYATPDRVFEVVEGFLKAAWAAAGMDLPTPFTRLTYDQAIRQYGSDKPDLRLPPLTDVRDCFAPADLETLKVAPGPPVVAIRIPKVGELSRKERDDIKPLLAERQEAKVFEDIKRLEKSFPAAVAKIREKTQAAEGDLLVIVAGDMRPDAHRSEGGVKPEVKQHDHAVSTAAGALRVALAQKYAERHGAYLGDRKDPESYRILWVTDFPMFEYDDRMKTWAAAHHPFTSPYEQDLGKLESGNPSDLGAIRALAYDVVLNGTEMGSGSVRIHRQDVQKKVFRALGMSDDEARARFGFFLEALEYGTPPHGGIALGLDRIVMMLAGADSLREVIPFPKTAKAVDLMVDAPTPVSEAQLKELGIAVEKKRRQTGAMKEVDQKDSYVQTTWFCLDELEKEYLRIGEQYCEALQQKTQLSAFLLLGVRSVSLLRGMFRVLEEDFLDSHDAIRRAFLETWQLQYCFRLAGSVSQAQKWLQDDGSSWKPDWNSLEDSNKKLGLGPGNFAKEYGMLSELAHPTYDAAVNSCAIASTLRGINPNVGSLQQGLVDLSGDFMHLVNRQIWLTLVEGDHLVRLPISRNNLELCIAFHQQHSPK